jgi:hypothetical protein
LSGRRENGGERAEAGAGMNRNKPELNRKSTTFPTEGEQSSKGSRARQEKGTPKSNASLLARLIREEEQASKGSRARQKARKRPEIERISSPDSQTNRTAKIPANHSQTHLLESSIPIPRPAFHPLQDVDAFALIPLDAPSYTECQIFILGHWYL